MSDRVAVARAIAARTRPRFIEIPRERRAKGVSEKEMRARRGGLSAEEYRLLLIRKWGER